MTTQETSELIVGKLERYLKERPIVTVRLINYKISVIGEVSRPGVYTVNNEQVNVFEAVAMAGDLTIYGKRDNVRIIRTVDGKQNLVTINLNDENIIYSPTFIYGRMTSFTWSRTRQRNRVPTLVLPPIF